MSGNVENLITVNKIKIRKSLSKFFIYASLLFSIFIDGCSKEENNPVANLNARLELINQNGIDTSYFLYDSTLLFQFELLNSSSIDTIMFEYHQSIQLDQNFLMVYKKNSPSSEMGNSTVEIGKPWVGEGIQLSSYLVKIPPSNKFTVCSLNWLNNPNNLPLTKGQYYTDFAFNFRLEKKTKSFHIHRDFTIQ